ncbi:MAG: TlpA family protein disulfide reductase [Bacteroidetes bacterium]|nr:TlpA family protein disulfide reductase [Bacteroidota bacterium]
MKKNFIILAVLLSLAGSSCKEKSTGITLSGKIESPGSPLLLAEDEYSDTYDTITVKNGTFSTPIIMDNPGIKYLITGKTRKALFLAPGYALNVTIGNTAVPDSSSIKIEGEGAAENYILDSVLIAQSKLNYGFIYSVSPAMASRYIDSSYSSLIAYFERLSASFGPAFTEFEKAELSYGAASFKLHIGMQKEVSDPAYYAFLKNTAAENERYMNLPGYRSFMDAYLNSGTQLRVPADLADEQYLDSLLVTIEGLKNKKIREYYLFNKISMFVGGGLVENPEKYRMYFEKHNTNPEYAKAFAEILANMLTLSPGQEAPPFVLEDAGGKEISLHDFKGHIVFLDFWATWCHPCMEEMPAYNKLKADYGNKGIVFLSISLDEDKSKWENYLKNGGSPEGSLHAEKGMESDVAKAYQVNAIPLFTLIDKQGRIVEYSTAPPSSAELRTVLDSLTTLP